MFVHCEMMLMMKEKEKFLNEENRSFNVLGQLFEIPTKHLHLYSKTFLADSVRLKSYWNSHLNAYFLSRNVQIFEKIILTFYRSKNERNRIKFTPMISLTEKQFRDELKFYDLLQFYQIDDVKILLVEYSHLFSSSIYKDLKYFLFAKCFCRMFVDTISTISCSIGIFELIVRRCSSRHWSFIFLDICFSLILLTIFFYEQFIDRIWLKIQSILHNSFHEEIRANFIAAPIVLVSYQSSTFIFQIILAAFSFIPTIFSFSITSENEFSGSWFFILAVAFRHLLLIRLCLPDFCHLIDILVYSGRLSLLVLSRFFVFILTILFVCVWLGLIVFISDSNLNEENFPPSRYVYFIYEILFNVGYGDTIERTFLSFLFIVLLSLLFYPLLLLTFEDFLQQMTIINDEFSHVKTFHRSFDFDEFIKTFQRLKSSKKKTNVID